MRRLLLAATVLPLALSLCAAAAAAQGRAGSLLVVHVLDEQGRPLMGARVSVGGVERVGTSGADGVATVGAIPQGVRLVEVRRQGYAWQRVAADFTRADTVRREVVMTPAPVELEGLTVTTWGRSTRLLRNGFYERQRRGFGSFMSRDQIERLRPYHATDAFRYLPGFAVVPYGARDIVVATRGPGGFGGCLPQVYVDGNRMFVRGPEDQADALETVPPENIEAIEAYQGAASIPAEYNATGSVCGVLLIWTRG